MNFEEYLKSEQARSTIAKLIEVYPDQTIMNTMAEFHVQWELADAGAWRRVAVYGSRGALEPPLATVYYRPEGDRFVVSDLGDVIRAFELRTGLLRYSQGTVEALRVAGGYYCGPGYRIETSTVPVFMLKADQLPNAICRVLLASYRVANLPDQPAVRL